MRRTPRSLDDVPPPRGRGAARDASPSAEPLTTAIEIGHGGIDVEVGAGGVWITTMDALIELHPATNATGTIVGRANVPDSGSSWGGDLGIDAADGTVWMAGTTTLN
jgi:hypothetical protein